MDRTALQVQQVAKEICIGQYDAAYIYSVMRCEKADMGIRSFADAIIRLVTSRGSMDTQTRLLNLPTLFGRKEVQGRKAGLTEFVKPVKRTPRGSGATSRDGGSTKRATLAAATFGEAAKAFSPREKSGAK